MKRYEIANDGSRMRVAACLSLFMLTTAMAEPTIVESGWTQTQFWEVVTTSPTVSPVAYNPDEGLAYVGRNQRASNGGGIYRLNIDGTSDRVVAQDSPSGLAFDPEDGDMFFSQAGGFNGGVIFRAE